MVYWGMAMYSRQIGYRIWEESDASIVRLGEAEGSTETLVTIFQPSCCHVPKDHKFYVHCHERLGCKNIVSVSADLTTACQISTYVTTVCLVVTAVTMYCLLRNGVSSAT